MNLEVTHQSHHWIKTMRIWNTFASTQLHYLFIWWQFRTTHQTGNCNLHNASHPRYLCSLQQSHKLDLQQFWCHYSIKTANGTIHKPSTWNHVYIYLIVAYRKRAMIILSHLHIYYYVAWLKILEYWQLLYLRFLDFYVFLSDITFLVLFLCALFLFYLFLPALDLGCRRHYPSRHHPRQCLP